jgi:cysteine desulfurase
MLLSKPIYLDNNATTPVDDMVLQKMLPYFSEKFGNAASKTHSYGWIAEDAVDLAREQVANFIGAEKEEIVFTSGSTEAINMALKGTGELQVGKKEIITVKTEHKATLDTCQFLESKGFIIKYLDVTRDGLIDLNQLNNSITQSTILLSIMMANNETGVIQPIEQVGKIAKEKGVLFFSDATQAAGKLRIDVNELNADMLCISAHKVYGPKGIGALYVRRKNPRVTLVPQLHGGGHEKGLRSGTLNVPAIVGLGAACEIANERLWEDGSRISKLRTVLEQALTENNNAFINGSTKNRIFNTTNICFKNITAADFIAKFKNIAIATGSACTSASNEPSHVLRAMGLTEKEAQSSIRFSLGRNTTIEEIENVIAQLQYLK